MSETPWNGVCRRATDGKLLKLSAALGNPALESRDGEGLDEALIEAAIEELTRH